MQHGVHACRATHDRCRQAGATGTVLVQGRMQRESIGQRTVASMRVLAGASKRLRPDEGCAHRDDIDDAADAGLRAAGRDARPTRRERSQSQVQPPILQSRSMRTARCAVRSGQSRRINYGKAGMRPLCDTAQCPAHVTARFALPASPARNAHNGSVSMLSNRPARPASASWTSASRTGQTRSCGSAC